MNKTKVKTKEYIRGVKRREGLIRRREYILPLMVLCHLLYTYERGERWKQMESAQNATKGMSIMFK